MKNSLLDNFYTEVSSTWSVGQQGDFISVIRLDPAHVIFKGHFEQVPIAPGVCLTQIIKEILMEKMEKELIMTHGDNIKFLAMINPQETPELVITFNVRESDSNFLVSATYSHNGRAYTKFKGQFRVAE